MYTLWSHGELVGESALDYARAIDNLRSGDLHLTAKGLTLMERLSQTHADAYYTARRLRNEAINESDMQSLEADLAAERDQYESLALELHASDGAVIPTEDIWVADTEYLLAIDAERENREEEALEEPGLDDVLDPDELRAFKEELAELQEDFPPWASHGPEREPVRFQIHVRLKSEWSIP